MVGSGRTRCPHFFGALAHQPEHTVRQKAVRDLCTLYVLTGLRLNEGATLRWEHVDLKRKTITIAGEQAKNHQKHELPIGDWLTNLLTRYQEANAALPARKRSRYVFASENKAGHLKDFGDVIEGIGKAAGLDCSPHDLRRTFLTITNNHFKGLSAYTIKRLVNHATDSADVTAGYIIQDAETLREPMQQVETFILRAAGVLDSAPVIELASARKAG